MHENLVGGTSFTVHLTDQDDFYITWEGDHSREKFFGFARKVKKWIRTRNLVKARSRIIIHTTVDNTAIKKMLEKLGFKKYHRKNELEFFFI